jgi:hypothetical protein
MKNIWREVRDLVRPLQGRDLLLNLLTVGFTHGYSHCSPSANRYLHVTYTGQIDRISGVKDAKF